jgi:MFS family permease
VRREPRDRGAAEDLTTGSMLMAAAGGEPARPVRTLLADRTFGPYFWGQAVATMGVWIHNVAAAILMWDLTRSTQWVAAITIGQFLPQVLVSPWSGGRADRADRRRQMVAGTLVTGFGPAVIAVWEALVGFEDGLGPVVLIVAATVIGTGFALSGPATQALLPSLVRRTELPTVVAVSSWPMTIARAAGPALGALLMVTSGAAVTFGLVAVTQFAFAAAMHRRERETLMPADGRDTRVRAALTYLRAERPTAFLLLGVGVVGFGVDPVVTLAPAVADRLGGAGDVIGLLASAFGVGAGVGFVLLPLVRRRQRLERMATVGLVLLALGLAPLAVAPNVAAAIADVWDEEVALVAAAVLILVGAFASRPALTRRRRG